MQLLKPITKKAIVCAILSKEVYQDFNATTVFSGFSKSCNPTFFNEKATDTIKKSDLIKFADFPEAIPEWIDQSSTDTQGAILLNNTSLYIVFQGSVSRYDWLKTNINIFPKEINFQLASYKLDKKVKIHGGFENAYFSVREQIHKVLNTTHVENVTVTGHSLGGALATLCAIDLQNNFNKNIEVYTFGSPRVGNSAFCEFFNLCVSNSFRFVNFRDEVPNLPPKSMTFRHVQSSFLLWPRFSFSPLDNHDIARYVDALKEQEGNLLINY